VPREKEKERKRIVGAPEREIARPGGELWRTSEKDRARQKKTQGTGRERERERERENERGESEKKTGR